MKYRVEFPRESESEKQKQQAKYNKNKFLLLGFSGILFVSFFIF